MSSIDILALGDITSSSGVTEWASIATRINTYASTTPNGSFSAFLGVGDLVYDAGWYSEMLSGWDHLTSSTLDDFGQYNSIMYPVPGNHDFGNPAGVAHVPVWSPGSKSLGSICKISGRYSATEDVYFVATKAGATGGSQPAWNKTRGATTNDGSVIWTAVDPGRDYYAYMSGRKVGGSWTAFSNTNEPANYQSAQTRNSHSLEVSNFPTNGHASSSSQGYEYYAFDLINGSVHWRCYALSSELEYHNFSPGAIGATGISTSSPQYQWLQADLASFRSSNPDVPILAYWHTPVFSAMGSYSDNSNFNNVFSLLATHGCRLILNGHAHNYQRYYPMDTTTAPVQAAKAGGTLPKVSDAATQPACMTAVIGMGRDTGADSPYATNGAIAVFNGGPNDGAKAATNSFLGFTHINLQQNGFTFNTIKVASSTSSFVSPTVYDSVSYSWPGGSSALPPNLTITTPSQANTTVPYNTTAQTIAGSTSDPNAGGSITSVTINGTAVAVSGGNFSTSKALTVGSNSFSVVATNSEHLTTPVSLTVIRSADTTRPTLTVSSPSSPTTNVINSVTTFAVTGSASDSESGLANVKVNGTIQSLSGGNFSTSVPLSVGSNSITVVATDNSGNANSQSFAVIRASASGPLPPALTITTPSQTSTTVANTVTTQIVAGSASDPNSGGSITSVTVNGSPVTVTSGNFSTTVSLGVGTNSIPVIATSSENLQTPITLSVTRLPDTTNPTLIVTQPIGFNTTVPPNVSTQIVAGSATDASGILSVTVNGVVQALDVSGDFATTVNLNPGATSIPIVVTDASANQNVTQQTYTVTRSVGTHEVGAFYYPIYAVNGDSGDTTYTGWDDTWTMPDAINPDSSTSHTWAVGAASSQPVGAGVRVLADPANGLTVEQAQSDLANRLGISWDVWNCVASSSLNSTLNVATTYPTTLMTEAVAAGAKIYFQLHFNQAPGSGSASDIHWYDLLDSTSPMHAITVSQLTAFAQQMLTLPAKSLYLCFHHEPEDDAKANGFGAGDPIRDTTTWQVSGGNWTQDLTSTTGDLGQAANAAAMWAACWKAVFAIWTRVGLTVGGTSPLISRVAILLRGSWTNGHFGGGALWIDNLSSGDYEVVGEDSYDMPGGDGKHTGSIDSPSTRFDASYAYAVSKAKFWACGEHGIAPVSGHSGAADTLSKAYYMQTLLPAWLAGKENNIAFICFQGNTLKLVGSTYQGVHPYGDWDDGNQPACTSAMQSLITGMQTPLLPAQLRSIASDFYPADFWSTSAAQATPARAKLYSSANATALNYQFAQMSAAGINVCYYEWAPPTGVPATSRKDALLPGVLTAAEANNIQVAIVLTAWNASTHTTGSSPSGERNNDTLVFWINYIETTYGSHPAFYKTTDVGMNGFNGGAASLSLYLLRNPLIQYAGASPLTPPVLGVTHSFWQPFVNACHGTPSGGTGGVAVTNTCLIIASDYTLDQLSEDAWDGGYIYNAVPLAQSGAFSLDVYQKYRSYQMGFPGRGIFVNGVMPGYSALRVQESFNQRIARNNGAFFDGQWNQFLNGVPQKRVAVSTWNNWIEGTMVEPACTGPPNDTLWGYYAANGTYQAAPYTFLDYETLGATGYVARTAGWVNTFQNSDLPEIFSPASTTSVNTVLGAGITVANGGGVGSSQVLDTCHGLFQIDNQQPSSATKQTTASTVAAKTCRSAVSTGSARKVYFDIVNTFYYKYGGANTFTIAMTYYDSGSGTVSLIYDGQAGTTTHATTITLGGTNTWKQFQWTLTDGYFGGRLLTINGSEVGDFYIQSPSAVTFWINTIQVTVSTGAASDTTEYYLFDSHNPNNVQSRLAQQFTSTGVRVQGQAVITPNLGNPVGAEVYTPAQIFREGFESGDFSNWTTTQIDSPATMFLQTTTKHAGTEALEILKTGPSGSIVYCQKAITPINALYARFYFRYHTLPDKFMFPLEVLTTNGGNQPQIRFQPNGTLVVAQLSNAPGGAEVSTTFFATALTVDTWYRIECKVDFSSSSSGTVTARLYTATGTEITSTIGGVTVTQTSSSGLYTQDTFKAIRMGNCNATNTVVQAYIDDVGVNSNAGGWIGA